MEKEKKFMIIGVLILLITLVGAAGTYAWFTWSSTNNTNLTMSIGTSSDVIFKNGNDISTNKLAPVFNYTDGEKTSFTITNKSTTSFSYRISLNITSIDNELKNKSLKYKLVSNNTIITEGDFSNIENTNKLYEGELSKGNISYIFYLYIDGNEENDLNMINKSLVGTITVSEGLAKYYMKGYDTSFNKIDYNGNECLNAAFPDEGEGCMVETGPKFLNSDISVAQVSTINVVKLNEVPSGVGSAVDISGDQNGSVLLYSKTSSETSKFNGFDLYDLYIATENGKVYLTSGAILFEYMINLKSIDLTNMYTDEVTDMSGMFVGCISLENIDASNFNTSNVTNMSYMFSGWGGILGVSSIKNINVSGFDTSKVTDMSGMFYNLRNLITLDVSDFNTSKVTDMSYMFYLMEDLTTIYASNTFTTSAVTNSNHMFVGCEKLVGGNGTKYNSSYEDKTYARIDTSSTPGYFTLKN